MYKWSLYVGNYMAISVFYTIENNKHDNDRDDDDDDDDMLHSNGLRQKSYELEPLLIMFIN